MPLGTDFGLSLEDFVLDGDTLSLPKKGAKPQIFGPCLLWPNGWMDEAGILGMEVGLSPGDFVLDGDPFPNFRPISIVAKRLDASKCHLVRM